LSYNGGSSSAQRFDAGGYEFLHITLEMQPGDAVLQWAESIIAANPGLPTIVTTHDYLSTSGKRLPNPLIDLARIEPENHNSAEQLWRKLIRRHDQIFLVLCGHQHGQSFRSRGAGWAQAAGRHRRWLAAPDDFRLCHQPGDDYRQDLLASTHRTWIAMLTGTGLRSSRG
jgi:hypothetical protein